MTEYVVLIEETDTGWGAWSPDLDVYASAPTRQEAETQVREAIVFHLDGLRELGSTRPLARTTAIIVAA